MNDCPDAMARRDASQKIRNKSEIAPKMTRRRTFEWFPVGLLVVVTVLATQDRCRNECSKTVRVVGPTAPPATRPHPFAIARFPTNHSQFCDVGCALFFEQNNVATDCEDSCDYTYRYTVTVGYNDLAEVARYACRDGCNIGLYYCQAGYYCTGGEMLPCAAGKYRTEQLDDVTQCDLCPKGRYASGTRGTGLDHCDKCPENTYLNATGSTSNTNCLRCPAGKFADEKGMPLCKCITKDSCTDQWDESDRDTIPFVGRW